MKQFFLFIFLASSLTAFSQNSVDSIKQTLQKFILYWNIGENVPADTLANWVVWLDSAENNSITQQVRFNNYQKFFSSLIVASGDVDADIHKSQLRFYSGVSVTNNSKLQWYKEPGKFTPNNQLAAVKKVGSGPINVIAVAAPGYDGREFDKITEHFKQNYTFWVITLPGAGATAPYKLPQKREPSVHPWLNNVVLGIENLVKKERLNNFFVLTHGRSAAVCYLLSKSRVGKNITGAININAFAGELLNSRNNPSQHEGPEEKKYRIDHRFPFNDFTAAEKAFTLTRANTEAFDSKMVLKSYAELNKLTSAYIPARYQDEAFAVDVNEYIGKLPFPLLVINPLYDPLINVQLITSNRFVQSAWQKIKMNHPDAPLYLSFIQGRDFFFWENANEISSRLVSFLNKDFTAFANEPSPTNEVNASPAAYASQTFSNTDISIKYSKPAVKDREIFGKLVPYGKVWRAGANQATQISFTRDVKINGTLLSKGIYTLYVIPDESEWTFVFNKLINQWGAFGYSDKYDALRVKGKVETIRKQEWLSYNFENLSPRAVDLSLSWDTKKATITFNESFEKPVAGGNILNMPWIKLLDDSTGDHRNKSSADGKALSYYYDKGSDSLWFKYETYNQFDQQSPAISISLDTDDNQNNGVNWYGTNRSFKVDFMLSVGPTREGNGYTGFNGITDASGIRTANWINVKENCIRFYFDETGHEFYIGIKKSGIGINLKKINLIGSVGANATWNDDIGKNGTFATIEFE